MIEKLCDQRTRLWELALEKLCETEIAALGIRLGGGEILDEGASDLCQALIDKGVKVPLAIMVSRRTPNSVFHATLFRSRPELAQALFDVGFRSMEALESPSQVLELRRTLEVQSYSNILPLLHQSCLALNLDMVTWCLEYGCRSVVEVDGTIHFASHTLATGFSRYGIYSPGIVFGMLEKSGLIPRLLSLEEEYGKDQCICYCSLNGCSAITLLTKIFSEFGHRGANWQKKIGIVYEWLRLSQMSPSVSADSWEDFFRVEIFYRLGMAHTCRKPQYGWYGWYPGTRLSREEMDELRDEDEKAGHVEELNKWIHDYRNEQLTFDGPKDEFWKIWFKKLKDKDHNLYVNETHREMWEKRKGDYLEDLEYYSNALATGEVERNPDWERDYDPDDYYKCKCKDICVCFKEE
jgi:hypothetical protein